MIIDPKTKIENLQYEGVFDVHPEEVLENISSLCLIDVRTPDEFTGPLGHIESSSLIVLDQLQQQLSKLPQDKTIIFICRSGNRSGQAALWAQKQGFQNVYNMKGGMLLWNDLEFKTYNSRK